MKKCPHCKKEKGPEEYHKNKNRYDGLASWCRLCCNERSLKRARAFPGEYAAEAKIWVSKNGHIRWAINTMKRHRDKFKVNFSTKELGKIARESKNCAFCNCSLNWENGRKLSRNSPTLERLENNDNLTLENVTIICHRCNGSKNKRNLNEFFNYITRVEPIIENLIKNQGNLPE